MEFNKISKPYFLYIIVFVFIATAYFLYKPSSEINSAALPVPEEKAAVELPKSSASLTDPSAQSVIEASTSSITTQAEEPVPDLDSFDGLEDEQQSLDELENSF